MCGAIRMRQKCPVRSWRLRRVPFDRECGRAGSYSAPDSMPPDGMRALVGWIESPAVFDDRQPERGILMDGTGKCPAFPLVEASGSALALRRP